MAARAPAKSNRSQRPKGLYQPPGLTAFVSERKQKDFFKYLYSQYAVWEKERKRCYYNARVLYRKKKNNRIKSFPSVTSASTPRHVTASVDADSNLDLRIAPLGTTRKTPLEISQIQTSQTLTWPNSHHSSIRLTSQPPGGLSSLLAYPQKDPPLTTHYLMRTSPRMCLLMMMMIFLLKRTGLPPHLLLPPVLQ